MRKIIVEAEVSLNGISDSPDFMGQVFNYHSRDVQDYLSELLFLPDALLMGRETYEFLPNSGQPRKARMRKESTAFPSTLPQEP